VGVCAWVPHLDVCALCAPASFQRPPCLLCCPSWACARRVCGFVRPSSCVFVFFSATISVTCRLLVCARAPRSLLFLRWHPLLALPSTQLPLVSAASRPRPPRSAQPRLPFHTTQPSVRAEVSPNTRRLICLPPRDASPTPHTRTARAHSPQRHIAAGTAGPPHMRVGIYTISLLPILYGL